MFEVGVVAQFEAAHRLRGDFGPAARLHGHTYRVEVSVRGDSLGPDDALWDVGRLQNLVSTVVRGLDYQNLDDLAGLTGHNTTAEVVARFIFDRIAAGVSSERVATLAVRVWESPGVWAGYEAPISELPGHGR